MTQILSNALFRTSTAAAAAAVAVVAAATAAAGLRWKRQVAMEREKPQDQRTIFFWT